MNGLKKMLLGLAFLMIALMGAITYECDGFVLFIIGAPIGLILCIIGCFDEQISRLFKKFATEENKEEKK